MAPPKRAPIPPQQEDEQRNAVGKAVAEAFPGALNPLVSGDLIVDVLKRAGYEVKKTG